MVTHHHVIGHKLFDEDPNLISRTLRRAGFDFPDLIHVERLSTADSVEHEADLLLRVKTSDGRLALVVFEIQHRADSNKPKSWGRVGMKLYYKYQLPVVFVVVATNEPCERWADECFDFGMGMGDMLAIRPLVVGPSSVRAIADVAEARADPMYAALSVVAHRDHPDIQTMLEAAIQALVELDDPTWDIIAKFIDIMVNVTLPAGLWAKLMEEQRPRLQGPTCQRCIADDVLDS